MDGVGWIYHTNESYESPAAKSQNDQSIERTHQILSSVQAAPKTRLLISSLMILRMTAKIQILQAPANLNTLIITMGE